MIEENETGQREAKAQVQGLQVKYICIKGQKKNTSEKTAWQSTKDCTVYSLLTISMVGTYVDEVQGMEKRK